MSDLQQAAQSNGYAVSTTAVFAKTQQDIAQFTAEQRAAIESGNATSVRGLS